MEQLVREIIVQLIPALASVLIAAGAAALYRLQALLKAKYNIEVSKATVNELTSIADDAVSFVNEVAHGIAKSGGTLESAAKEQLAIEQLKKVAAKHNLTDERARELILIALGHSRKWEDLSGSA